MDTVEIIWQRARDLRGDPRDRRRPSTGIAAVLTALHRTGPTHGSAIARAAGQAQHNVTAVWLPKLRRFGLVEGWEDTDRALGHQGGGQPAVIWALTRAGRALAEALAAEPQSSAAA